MIHLYTNLFNHWYTAGEIIRVKFKKNGRNGKITVPAVSCHYYASYGADSRAPALRDSPEPDIPPRASLLFS